jgi:hypothetical protein
METTSKLTSLIRCSIENDERILKIVTSSGKEYFIIRNIKTLSNDKCITVKVENTDTKLVCTQLYDDDSYMYRYNKTQNTFANLENKLNDIASRLNTSPKKVFKAMVRKAADSDTFWKEHESTECEVLDSGLTRLTNVYNDKLELVGSVYIDGNSIEYAQDCTNDYKEVIPNEYSALIDVVQLEK